MALKIYEEVGRGNTILSPACYGLRWAILYMGLEVEFIGVSLSGLEKLNFKNAPILKDGKRYIHSGIEIALYLERNFPDSPTIFGGELGTLFSKQVNVLLEDDLCPQLLSLLTEKISKYLSDQDLNILLTRITPYNAINFNHKLAPIKEVLSHQNFLCGQRPGYVDFLFLGIFSWQQSFGTTHLLSSCPILKVWKERMEYLLQKMVCGN